MKNIKKIIPAVIAAAALTTSAFAAQSTITVNNQALEGTSYIVNEGKAMLPVRAICEKLGFTVEYDEPTDTVTLVKLPVTISFVPTVDGYTFARTAPMKLGTDPILVNDRTYVPQEFFTEIINSTYTEENGVISISWGDETATVIPEQSTEEIAPQTVIATCSIKDITEKSILVADYERGEVVVFVTDETIITDKDGKAVKAADLDMNFEYTIEYAPAMTMSLPPQVTAIKITQTANEAKDVVEGEVCEILSEDGKVTAIAIGNIQNPTEQTVLNIADETSIKGADGQDFKAEDIKAGSYIRAITSTMTTRSLPPQKAAFVITVM